ncbi:MAG TPA: hypothetical protein VMT53_04015 [Terriglobales bacterium]|nr:hypothetical protein [Terriglobales bacterium]
MVKAAGMILVRLCAIAAVSDTAGYQVATTGVQDEASQKDPIKSVDVIGLVGVKDNTAACLRSAPPSCIVLLPKGTADIDAASAFFRRKSQGRP